MPRSINTPQRRPSTEYKRHLNALLNLYEVYKDLVALYLRDIAQSPGDMDVLYIRKLVPAIHKLVAELKIEMPNDYIPFETLSHAGKTLREKEQTPGMARENIYAVYGNLKKMATRIGAVGQEPIPDMEEIIIETSDIIARRIKGSDSDGQPKTRLSEQQIRFNDDNATIFVGSKRCPLPVCKYEHYFARTMWERPVGEPVSWDIVAEEMHEHMGGRDLKGKTVMDTMYRLNDRIREIANTDDELFSRKSQNIVRNYG